MINSYICIDLETTGLHPKRDKIIEIGAVKIVDGKKKECFSIYVNPGRKLEERITDLTGINDKCLKEAPVIEEIMPGLCMFLEDLPLLGHRILFDFSFLKKAAVDQKLPFTKEGIDTLKIARKYLDSLKQRSLEYLCGYYGIPHKAHRALSDAEAAGQLYRHLAQDFYREEESAFFHPQKLSFSVKRDTPITIAQKERLYRLIEQHKLVIDYDVERLTRSEASRYTDRILSSYGR